MTPESPRSSRHGFPRSFRIRKRPDFLRVQRNGHRQVLADLVAVHRYRRMGEDGVRVRVGFTVSKKVGNAVVRNRVKRRLREAVRHSWDLLGASVRPMDIVFIARGSASKASSEQLHRQVDTAFRAIAGFTERRPGRRSGGRR